MVELVVVEVVVIEMYSRLLRPGARSSLGDIP